MEEMHRKWRILAGIYDGNDVQWWSVNANTSMLNQYNDRGE